METLLDDSVGREIDLEIERGGSSLTVKLEVVCIIVSCAIFLTEISNISSTPTA
jgi:hypothetical protein